MRRAVGVLGVLLVAFAGLAPAQTVPKPEKVAELRMALRDLLVEQIHWSRTLVLATRAGKDAGQKFAGLFTAHSRAVKDYLQAALSGRAAAKKAASERAVKNARDMDALLSGANPNLPQGAVLNLLGSHWAHHVAQIESAAKRDWAGEARVWHDMRKHILTIADALVEAIAKQFAERLQ
ncbi:MAG: hypothetical protein QN151_00280 [Armatimonadota bacterium]|nr:hypothetical protein [Armatimonadota bacterium]MDR7412698.1 hypothetical protein [Armatimonadota bacterium]MDR7589177.1 hypothetical protein [Armatimonadota bacterium]